MPIYMVERIVPGASLAALEAITEAAEAACRAFSAQGQPIHYRCSTFTPGESRCRCLFEAADAEVVRALNEAAQIPYNRIILAIELHGGPTTRLESSETDSPVRPHDGTAVQRRSNM